ncbi:MAG: hypothetical protein M1820_009026 [Bogoriella megaspora]|nr:MAG: hypothetical protein M1820_009026 [Bogoriella megaspora]
MSGERSGRSDAPSFLPICEYNKSRRMRRVFKFKRNDFSSSQTVAGDTRLASVAAEGTKISRDVSQRSGWTPSPSLWAETLSSVLSSSTSLDFQKLAHNVQVECSQSEEWRLCNEVYQFATESSNQSLKHDSVIAKKAAEAFRGIAIWVQKFVSVGDVIAQIDPIHAGPPWAFVRAILIVAVSEFENDVTLLRTLERVSQLIYRYGVFEQVYLHSGTPLEVEFKAELENALRSLYETLTTCLLEVNDYFTRSKPSRLLHSLTVSNKLKRLLEDVESKEKEVQSYETIALRAASYNQFVEVRKILGAYDDHLQANQRDKILSWISETSYHAHHRDIFDKVHPGTGRWLFEKPAFTNWQQGSRSSLLWLRGDAGVGKSCLTSCVVDHYLRTPQLDSSHVIAYFYCSSTSGDAKRHDVRQVMGSLLRQVSSPLPGLPLKPPILSKYTEEAAKGSRDASFSIAECTQLMQDLFAHHYQSITLIIDAVDECNPKERLKFINLLNNFLKVSHCVIKVFISSRAEPDFERHLLGSATYYIDAVDNASDIVRYVKTEVNLRLLHGSARDEIKELVIGSIAEKANGVFRWAALHIESLCDSDHVHDEITVRDLLNTLPITLKATYAETLDRLRKYPESSRIVIENVLKLLLCAERTMEVSELLAGATLLSGRTDCAKLSQDDLVRMSRHFLVRDRHNAVLRFAHLSVKEFLESEPEFSKNLVHAVAAITCLKTYLFYNQKPRSSLTAFDDTSEQDVLSNSVLSFASYAHAHLGRHCKKAGSLRRQSPIAELLSRFLVGDGQTGSGFETWFAHCDVGDFGALNKRESEKVECKSQKRQPLFMACVYDFDDIVEAFLQTSSDQTMLRDENLYGRTVLEVASRYGSHASLAKLLVFTEDPISQPQVDKLLLAAGNFNTLDCLLSKGYNAPNWIPVIESVAQNVKNGQRMVDMVLQRPGVKFDESILLTAMSKAVSIEIVTTILDRCGENLITSAVLNAATSNVHLGAVLTKQLLKLLPHVTVTNDMLASASLCDSLNMDGSIETLKLLLAHPVREPVTEDALIHIAAHCSSRNLQCLELLLSGPKSVTEDLLCAAASNTVAGPASLEHLLSQSDNAPITQHVLQSAALNRQHAGHMLELLLRHKGSPSVGDETMHTLCETNSSQNDVIDSILNRQEDAPINITNDLLECMAYNRSQRDMASILALPRWRPVSGRMVELALRNWQGALEQVKYLYLLYANAFMPSSQRLVQALDNQFYALELTIWLRDLWKGLPVDESVVKAAVRTTTNTGLILSLLRAESTKIEVTAGILEAAATQNNPEVMESLCQMKSIPISTSILRSAIQPCSWGNGFLKLLLADPTCPDIDDEIYRTAAARGIPSTLDLLLEHPKATAPPPDLLEHAAGNIAHGYSMVQRLLLLEGQCITEHALINAAEHPLNYGPIFEALMSHLETEYLISEKILMAAVCNPSGVEATEMVIRYASATNVVTSACLQAALSQDHGENGPGPWQKCRLLRLLLNHIGNEQISNMDSLLDAAAQSREAKFTLQILFDHLDIPGFDESVLIAAAKNENANASLIRLLISHKGSRYQPSSEVLQAAARNKYRGVDLVHALLAYCSERFLIDENILVAATENTICGRTILSTLFQWKKRADISSRILHAASQNSSCGVLLLSDFLGLALSESDETLSSAILEELVKIEALQEALQVAACEGNLTHAIFLIDHGANVNTGAGDLGSPINIAVHAGHLEVVGLLISKGANINSRSTLRGTALESAVVGNHRVIVQLLVAKGVQLEAEDRMGRTLLQRTIRRGTLDMVKLLVEVGANIIRQDARGMNCLHWASSGSTPETMTFVLEVFLSANGSIDATDYSQWTALHWAAYGGNEDAVRKLIAKGANQTLETQYNRTAAFLAMENGHAHVQSILAPNLSPELSAPVFAEEPEESSWLRDESWALTILLPTLAKTGGPGAFESEHGKRRFFIKSNEE